MGPLKGREIVSYLNRCRDRVAARLGLLFLVTAVLGVAPLHARDDPQLAFGVQMAKRGLWSEALFRFKQADQAQPGNPKILNNLAVAYEAVGLFEEALAAYQTALKADPANRELRRNYARFIEFYQSFKPDEEPVEEEVPAALERPAAEAPGSSAEDAAAR